MATELQALIHECMSGNSGKPVVVFCMRKQDVYDGCRTYCQSKNILLHGAPLLEGLSRDTPEAELLSATMPHGVAIHCADLVENDRLRVEEALKTREVNLIFATSTLAGGGKFSSRHGHFYSWRRWNFDRQSYEPISAGEFHKWRAVAGWEPSMKMAM